MTDLCRKYYVDSINGSDTNDGLSENSAFASLFAVNRLALKPGDHILLACGSVFEKQFLQIRDSGTKQMPIVIGSYGCGEDPLIKTDGQGIWYQDYGKELFRRRMFTMVMFPRQYFYLMPSILSYRILRLQTVRIK